MGSFDAPSPLLAVEPVKDREFELE